MTPDTGHVTRDTGSVKYHKNYGIALCLTFHCWYYPLFIPTLVKKSKPPSPSCLCSLQIPALLLAALLGLPASCLAPKASLDIIPSLKHLKMYSFLVCAVQGGSVSLCGTNTPGPRRAHRLATLARYANYNTQKQLSYWQTRCSQGCPTNTVITDSLIKCVNHTFLKYLEI